MTPTLTRETIHQELVRNALSGSMSETDALRWMVLLHTHVIHLHPDAIVGANGLAESLGPLTQRGAAEVIAAVWSDLSPQRDERSDYEYWYRQYNSVTPYEVVEDVPGLHQARLCELRDTLIRDARIANVAPED